MLGHNSLPIMFVLYTTYRYGWDQKTIGLVLAVFGIMSIVVQGGLVGRIVAAVGERRSLAIGLACGAAAMVVYAMAPTGRLFLLGIAMTALYGSGAAFAAEPDVATRQRIGTRTVAGRATAV